MLTLILGPMKSGKSLELIARLSPYKHTRRRLRFVQPHLNVRDASISSRAGISFPATKLQSLSQLDITSFDVVGIDEIHMFSNSDITTIISWIKSGKEVVASGLDLDYRGQMFDIVQALHQLKPDNLVFKTAVCDTCHQLGAQFTTISHLGQRLTDGLPSVVPEDGTYTYHATCRNCFLSSPIIKPTAKSHQQQSFIQ